MSRRRLAVLVTALTFALPGSALGQSAGDDEYQNPLPEPEPAPSAQAQEQPAQEPAAPAQAGPAAPEPAPAPAGGGPELPRTGLPAGLVAGAGLALLAGGASLRRRL